MDFEVTVNDLFSYIGKLYVETEEAKKLLMKQVEENKSLQNELKILQEKDQDENS